MTLDWTKFRSLSDSPDKNFELLCRGIVRHNFGQYGLFISHANMAGVEFYLDLNADCPLGQKSRVFGWQCKWFELAAGKPLGKNRRDIIEDGINKTIKYHPEVTDWVLWTKETLTKDDQNWFKKIKTKLTLHLYDSNDIEKYKVGPAEIFIKSYFGELALTDLQMKNMSELSIAPIRQRWIPELHQETNLDRQVKKILGCKVSWEILDKTEIALYKLSSRLLEKLKEYQDSNDYLDDATLLVMKSLSFCEHIVKCKESLAEAAADWADLIDDSQDLTLEERSVPRKFRQRNDRNGLLLTNLLALYVEGKEALVNLKKSLKQSSLVISSEAGNGKTEFCAQLCSGLVDGVQGIIIHAKRLSRNAQYNDLLKSFTINGRAFESFESLICTLNSYGERSRKRILVAFDGLNESEDSRKWKDIIPEIQAIVQKYQRVFCLFTIRPDYLKDSIPSDEIIEVLKGEGFQEEGDAEQALQRYFNYYKIKSVRGALPKDMLRHPLSLKLFCEVTNPKREFAVNINSGPKSLYSLFKIFIKRTSEQIAELSNIDHRIYGGDVQKALSQMGEQLWTSGQRGLGQDEFRALINDSSRPWNFSILNSLESEGVLIRSKHGVEEKVMPVYDRLAGYLIAESILEKCSSESFKEWIADLNNYKKLFGSYNEAHPYSEDIVSALVALFPQRFCGVNLWKFLSGDKKDQVLIKCAELEAAYLDQCTISELEGLIVSGKSTESLWLRLYFLYHLENHPLNIDFLDKALSRMDISTRDKSWSEWIRGQKSGFLLVLKQLPTNSSDLTENRKSAIYYKWCLTLTDREIRDLTSLSLFEFGKKNYSAIFNETIKSLSINDDYIAMRLVPISFSIITDILKEENKDEILAFYTSMCNSLIGRHALNPSNNIIIRKYFLKTREFLILKKVISSSDQNTNFALKVEPLSILEADPLAKELSRALHMDFENYTLGALFKGRRNYDNNHQEHKNCVSYIRGLLASFRWNTSEMMELDKRIYNYQGRGSRASVERYGKKYSWIGFYRYAGMLDHNGKLDVHYDYFTNGDIDPSFIRPPKTDIKPFSLLNFKSHSEDKDWFVKSNVNFPNDVYKRKEIENIKAPWILLYGYYSDKDEVTNRGFYGITQSVLVKKSDVKKLRKEFEISDPYSILQHEAPRTHEILANEIPWSRAAIATFREFEQYNFRKAANISVEYLVNEYSYEKNGEWLETASSYYYPSYRFINKQKLERIPGTLAFRGEKGKLASISLQHVSDEKRCHMFYMNLDELRSYAKGKVLMTFCWGKKELDASYYDGDGSWLIQLERERRDYWKKVFLQNL